MTTLRRLAIALCAAPLTLALAACGSDGEDAAAPSGEALAPIAAPQGTSWVETAVETPEGGSRTGHPDAPTKLVESASHPCHVCAEFAQTGAAPLDEYVAKGTVSYEIRNLIRDPIDLTIAMLARCGPPTVFHPLANQAWGQFDSLMQAVQTAGPALDAASQQPPASRLQAIAQASGVMDFFAARGISRDQAMQCLADTDKAQRISTNSQTQGDELAITGTPTFFLNGNKVEGTNWPSLEAALQAAGAR